MGLRSLLVLALLALVLSLVVPYAAAAPAKKQVKIITPHWEGIRYEYKLAFEKWYREKYGEEVEVVFEAPGGTGVCVRVIEDWFSKHEESNWDILWGGGVDPFLRLKEKGLLIKFSPEEDPEWAEMLSKVPKGIAGIPMYDPEYYWFGTALSGFGIIYNKAVLKAEGLPEPKTWEDLAKPELMGWVASADPRRSGSTHMCYEIILQAYGWEKGWEIITLIGANVKDFPEHSSAIPEMVATGEAAYGLAIDFYAWAQIAKVGAEKIGYVMPEGLTVINPDSIAILKNPPNPELAKIFVKFVMSKAGQKLWMLPAGKYPDGPQKYTLGRMCVLPELYDELKDRSIVPVNPFEVKSVLEYDPAKGGKRWSVVNDLFGALIIDTHDELVAAWKAIQEAKGKVPDDVLAKAYKELVKVPVSEEEALALAEKWGDQAFRNEKISEWRQFAEAKYQNARKIIAEALGRAEQAKLMQTIAIAVVAIVAIAAVAFFLIRKRKTR